MTADKTEDRPSARDPDMTRPRWTLCLLSAALATTGSVGALASGASAQATQSPCSLLSARAVQKEIHESVHKGAPNQFVPESCDYPLERTSDLPRTFAVSLDSATQCPSKLFKGRTVIKVGRHRGVYDISSRQETPKTEIHSPSLNVKVGASCVGVQWDLPSGPQPTGSRAEAIKQKLLRLEARAIKGLGS
jgi:hypothetical protein